MPFDSRAFMMEQYEPRTAEVSVPALTDFFTADEKPLWVVRSQTASEIALGAEAARKNKNVSSIVEAIGDSKDKVDKIKQAIGISDDTPNDIVIRLEQLTRCSISHEVDLPCALKLAETFPAEFYILTNKIVELTAMGMDRKKPKTSGKI